MFVESEKQQGLSSPLDGLLNLDNNKVKYQGILLGFAILVLSALFLDTAYTVLDFKYMTYTFSSIYLIDFGYRLYNSNDRKAFLKKYWVDLLLCLPIYPVGWMVVTTTMRSIKVILEYVLTKVTSAFHSMLILGLSLVVFATTSILQFETVEASNIKGFGDAVWWSICTITTVGFGDKFPVTWEGRTIATVLMIAGIGLFGTLIGYVSSYFVDKEKKHNDSVDTIEELSHQMHELREELKKHKQ